MQRYGNPVTYSTFLDESLNNSLRAVCVFAHRSQMERRIFQLFNLQGVLEVSPFLYGSG